MTSAIQIQYTPIISVIPGSDPESKKMTLETHVIFVILKLNMGENVDQETQALRLYRNITKWMSEL